jgi:phasin
MSDTPKYEIPGEMRDLAEKSVNQARQAFGNFLNVARRTASGIQDSTELTRTTTRDLSARSFDAAE